MERWANITYYLLFYASIIIVRYFKTVRLVKEKPNDYNWKHYFFVSLEVIYTSAGVAILLLAQQQTWIGVIMIIYFILLITSASVDTAGIGDNYRLFVHLGIIILIAFATILSYERFLPKSCEDTASSKHVVSMKHYYVMIPYQDLGFEKHVGVSKLKGRFLVYFTNVTAITRNDALRIAKVESMKGGKTSISPFIPKATLSTNIILDTEDAAVEDVTGKGVGN